MDLSIKALHKNIAEWMAGPLGSILIHVGIILAALFLVSTAVKKEEPEIEVQVVEVDDQQLDEILEDLKPPEELPDMVDTITPPDVDIDMTPPPDVADFTAAPVMDTVTELDIASDAISPIIMKNLAPGNMSNRSGAGRAAAIGAFGGKWGEYAEAAVLRALEWLRVNQNPDGSWANSNKEAMCGLGILTFLAHGETTASEKYGETVEKAIRYLCAKQNEKGEFSKITPNGAAPVYTQAICVYAISEAYGMTRIGSLKEVMEKGVQCIINGQQPGGGFDYGWKKESRRDTSLGGWCCQAMKAAYIAGAENQGLHEAMEKSIKDMKGAQREDGYFVYADGRGRITNMTAVACLSMQLLGHGEDKEVKDGMKFLNDADCSWDKPAECPLYAWYYLSQAKFHVGGNTWSTWNNKFAPLYIRHQNPDGSWLSPGVTGFKEGKDTVEREWMGSDIDSKVYATTLAALTLQVYYRFLPTYKPIETVTEEASDGDVAIEIL